MNRAAVSISSNIAEGSSRSSAKEYSRYLELALGSAFELETQLLISRELNYGNKQELERILNELTSIQKMINSFQKKVKAHI